MRRTASAWAILVLMSSATPALAQDAVIDSDGDGIADAVEDANGNRSIDSGETDPRNADTDGGGEADGSEVHAGRDPLDPKDDMTFDRDEDGLTNGEEAVLGTDPEIEDTDADGATDLNDPFPLDDTYKTDADGDKLPDEWEAVFGLSTLTDDANMDLDGDGLTNREEFLQGTNPLNNDTDRDGVTDGQELELGSDPGESACLSYRASASAFEDMDGHWAKSSVETLQRTVASPTGQSIVKGYPTPEGNWEFLPDRPVTRFELLKMTLLSTCTSLLEETQFGDASFTDVDKAPRPREPDDKILRRRIIFTAARLGIVQGYADGSFRPDSPVTRSEALKMLLNASQLSLHPLLQGDEDRTFPDVPQDEWFSVPVRQAVSLQLVEGYEDGTFRPHASITRSEAAKIVHYVLVGNPLVNGYVLPREEPEETEKAEERNSSSSSASSASSVS